MRKSIQLMIDVLNKMFYQCNMTSCASCYIEACCHHHVLCYAFYDNIREEHRETALFKNIDKFYKLKIAKCDDCCFKSNTAYCVTVNKALKTYGEDKAAQQYIKKIIALDSLGGIK